MSSGGGASKTTKHRRAKPMVVPQHARSAALLSPSNPFASEEEEDHHPPMLKVSLSSISKLEVRSLKRRLTAELDEVRSLIARFDPQGGNFTTGKGGNKKVKTGNGVKKGDKGTVQIFKKCLNLLTKLMKHKDGWVFNVPVDAKGFGLHDYHTIVKEPMDLGTVKAKLGEGLYESPLDFAEDVRLTFNNAILYNPVGHEVHSMAKFLLSMFEEKWAPIELQYHSLHREMKPVRDVVLPRPAPVVEPLPAPTPSPSPPLPTLPPAVLEDRTLEIAESMTTPLEPETVTTTALEKPGGDEEAPVDIRDLTMDEKQRLSEELQDLPYDKLETVVQIVKKSNPELSQQDDEIELDIDSLDIQTLWELYSFVTGYKENLSNKKEEDQGFGSERDAESAHNIIQEPATGTERSRVTESGKAIRMSSSPVRQENKAGGSSSSNSSSSDSGSSSSDSDSDSSSGRGSDTGN
ncbi:unnamed protein product [Brassica rapa]|uniref:Bromo domain-containing protein n=1 Tax=Brassica campestris TaxID=3711 RepID=A0A3P5Z1D1_BRACM|nr:unnamed protein product [Brassica rapa]VDC65978.1 unnamed protein product [Brassica rapa]